MNDPIIKSMLDIDKYKITMSYAAWKLHKDVNVIYAFNNRTKKIPLAQYINIGELREQINYIKNLKFTIDELNYLKTWNLFEDEYINYLIENIGHQTVSFNVNSIGNDLDINFNGKWPIAIFYETMVLSIVNEMFANTVRNGMNEVCQQKMSDIAYFNLKDKLYKVLNNEIKFVEFGTRRRCSQEWQEYVVAECIRQCSDKKLFLGTSNCYLAKKLGIEAKGTIAHEWFMVKAALDYKRLTEKNSIAMYNSEYVVDGFFRDSFEWTQANAIDDWYGVYGELLSLVLPDTFGTNNFFKIFDKERATKCIGVRQDSGDPFEFGRKMINHYKSHCIDPKEKTIMFSDGLYINLIMNLNKEFANQINVIYGWGTNLSNDSFYQPLSIVVKVISANGIPTVKLSDNTAKATGTHDAMVKLYKNIFNPQSNYTETIY